MCTLCSINRLALLVVIVLSIPACNQASDTPKSEPQVSSKEPAKLPILYTLPPFTLTDQTGQKFGSEQLIGKPWIANFIFTRCPSTCPIQTANLERLQRRLKKLDGWDNVQLVSFTVDPTFDTPAVLAEYARRANADPKHWHFLTGSREDIWSLCRKGFKLAIDDAPPEAPSLIMHSPMFVLIDSQGRVRGFFDGTKKQEVAEAYANLQQLLKEDQTSKPSS